MLASIVIIRTVVSWTLTLEVEGCWPWQSPAGGERIVMTDSIAQGLVLLTQILEMAGVSALVLGFIVTTTRWIRHIQQQGILPSINRYRQSLGRTILIGLEMYVVRTFWTANRLN